MIGENEMTDSRSENEKEYIQYCIKYAETMTALEIQLHSCEDPEEIAKSALKVGADFYGGDWCGVVESDLEMEAWAPILGYHVDGRGISESGLHELEETGPMNRWI